MRDLTAGSSMRGARLRVTAAVFALLCSIVARTGVQAADNDPRKLAGTRHAVDARVIYPNRALDPSIQAELEPGPFTIPEGYKAIDLKFKNVDPKSGYESTTLRPGNIKCVKSKRPPRKDDFKGALELAAGEYLLIIGGFPGATGTLNYTLVPDDGPQGDPVQPDPRRRHPRPDEDLSWLYQGVWLPERYFPAGFRLYPDESMPPGDPPRGNGTQSVWRGIPLQRKGGQPSSSAGEHPYTVYIDGVAVYRSIASAKKNLQMGRESLAANTPVPLGEEAYTDEGCKGRDGTLFAEDTASDGVYCRRINVRYVRVGRVIFGLRVAGDRVKDYNPRANNSKHFIAHPTPSRDDVLRVAEQFVAGIRAYANDKGWLND